MQLKKVLCAGVEAWFGEDAHIGIQPGVQRSCKHKSHNNQLLHWIGLFPAPSRVSQQDRKLDAVVKAPGDRVNKPRQTNPVTSPCNTSPSDLTTPPRLSHPTHPAQTFNTTSKQANKQANKHQQTPNTLPIQSCIPPTPCYKPPKSLVRQVARRPPAPASEAENPMAQRGVQLSPWRITYQSQPCCG